MSNDCPRFGKWIGGCKFEARWDEELPRGLEVSRGSVLAIEALKDRVYIKDVCIRCGKEIAR